jgi:integrase
MNCSLADWAIQGSRANIVGRGTKAPTLDEVLHKYVTSKALRPSTAALYERAIWTALRPWVHKPVTAITVDMVLARHRKLSQTQKPSYANVPFQILRLLLYFAAETYQTPAGRPLIEDNPVRQLSRNKAWNKSPIKQSVIPEEKLTDWYQAVLTQTSPTARDFLLFAAFTGTTRVQGLKLRWDDVDFESKIIKIRAEVCQNKRGYALPMTEFLELLLGKRRLSRQDSDFVFPGRSGGHMSSTQRATSTVSKKIGHQFQMNDLRRGFISAAANCGIGQQVIKRLTNHSVSSDMTDMFVRVTVEDLAKAMEQISQHLIARMKLDIEDWRI